MSLLDLEVLVGPLSPGEPCGPNLEYDPLFRELDEAAGGRPERQLGNLIEPARGPDWARVQHLAKQLFRRTRDLRVAVAWTRALTATEGVVGAAAGLQLIARLLATWPTELHPVGEPGEEHPTTRWNVLTALDAPSGFVADLRALRLNDPGGHAACWSDMHMAVTTIRSFMGFDGRGLSELQSFLDHARESESLPAEKDEPELPGALPWSPDRQLLLDEICRVIDRGDFDAASVCRRAYRISLEDFANLASHISPERRAQVVAFFQGTADRVPGRPQ